MGDPAWSDELRAATRNAIRYLEFCPDGDKVRFKHIDGRFGWIPLVELVQRQLRVIDSYWGAVETFADEEELVRAGWAIG